MKKKNNEYLIKLAFTKYEGLNKAILSTWPSIRHCLHEKGVKQYQLESIKFWVKIKKDQEHYKTFLFPNYSVGQYVNLNGLLT